MRTTVDLPPAVHARARELAEQRGESLSSTLAGLVVRGLGSEGDDVRLGRSARTGLPLIRIGAAITGEQVAEALDDE